ncbi:non-canonical purine NTP phosphatase [Pelomyxa schiedti]|nr:non-canonical purine NTP phosphatase [Pelomyxa schiedti]
MLQHEHNNIEAVVASTNPVKVNATKEALSSMLSANGDTLSTVTVHSISVDSGVAAQPMSSAETLQGALNRAKEAQRRVPTASFWLGIEGGIEIEQPTGGDGDRQPPRLRRRLQAITWVVALSSRRPGVVGQARAAAFALPAEVADLVLGGSELGAAVDRVFGTEDARSKEGAVGMLTKGLITRKGLYLPAVQLALVPFFSDNCTWS